MVTKNGDGASPAVRHHYSSPVLITSMRHLLSVSSNPRLLCQHREFLRLLLQKSAELLGGVAGDQLVSLFGETLANFRQNGRSCHFDAQTLDHLAGSARGRDQSVIGGIVESRKGRLVDRRHLRQHGGAL